MVKYGSLPLGPYIPRLVPTRPGYSIGCLLRVNLRFILVYFSVNLKLSYNMKSEARRREAGKQRNRETGKQANRETWPGYASVAKKQTENRNMEIVFRDWSHKQKC